MSKVEEYRVIYYYSDSDHCFIASIPDLPGCVADGATIPEAISNVRDLAKNWIEIAEEYKEPVPSPSLAEKPKGEEISIFDAAAYILNTTNRITTKALQKLLYYCKAWSCGWFQSALFPESFEAWAEGPINRELFYKHKGRRIAKNDMLDKIAIRPLTIEQQLFIDKILQAYEKFSPDELGEMTHKELPWVEARAGVNPGQSSWATINEQTMMVYYGQGNT